MNREKSIHIRGWSKSYRRKQALQPLELRVREGVTGLLGPNGAGKSTLINMLATVERASAGSAEIYGHFLPGHGAHAIRQLLGYVPQRISLPLMLSGEEFLVYAAAMKGISKPEARIKEAARVLKEVNLTEQAKARIKSYSGGMRQRIGIAQALLGSPKLLLLDEPTTGLDPAERIRFRNLVRSLGESRTVILSTHIVSDLDTTCDDVVVFKDGRLRFQGSLGQLAAQAKNKVWERTVPFHLADRWYAEKAVVSSVREAEGIRLRYISDVEKVEDAYPVLPSLEDGYVAILKGDRI